MAVQGVGIAINSQNDGVVTEVNGQFVFDQLATFGDYSVVPAKDGDYLNGVTTYDLILITKHILNIDLLDSPYKFIAADVNRSGRISTLDLIELRKVIIALADEFSNNSSWRFVPAGYVFENPSDPLAESFPESININNLEGEAQADFVAIKIGDVNLSAVDDVQARAGYDMALSMTDMEVTAGQVIDVPLYSSMESIEGLQFALDISDFEFVDFESGLLDELNFSTAHLEKGLLLFSWNTLDYTLNADAKSVLKELFKIRLKVRRTGRLSDFMVLDNHQLNAEAYHKDGSAMGLQLGFVGIGNRDAVFELKQNVPNPFVDKTTIEFYMPLTSDGYLTITDASGRVLQLIKGTFGKGTNRIIVSDKKMPDKGVLFYTLIAGEYHGTGKMIKVD
jgi:hypothetical protein